MISSVLDDDDNSEAENHIIDSHELWLYIKHILFYYFVPATDGSNLYMLLMVLYLLFVLKYEKCYMLVPSLHMCKLV